MSMAINHTRSRQISFRQALNFAWPAFKDHFRLMAAVMLTLVSSWVALETIVVAGQSLGITFWALAHLAFFVLFSGLWAGFLHICMQLFEGRGASYADIYQRLDLGLRFFGGQLVYLLVLLAGLALLVVPGVILGTRYALFAFPLVFEGVGLKESFHRSAGLVAGEEGALLAFLLGLLFLNVLGASLLGIGLLVTVPISTLMITAAFRELEGCD
jgi:hypothetical protein